MCRGKPTKSKYKSTHSTIRFLCAHTDTHLIRSDIDSKLVSNFCPPPRRRICNTTQKKHTKNVSRVQRKKVGKVFYCCENCIRIIWRIRERILFLFVPASFGKCALVNKQHRSKTLLRATVYSKLWKVCAHWYVLLYHPKIIQSMRIGVLKYVCCYMHSTAFSINLKFECSSFFFIYERKKVVMME